MITDFDWIRRFVKPSVWILIFLSVPASVLAAVLQQAAVQDGCQKYQDPKTVEPLKKLRHPALDKGCVACHLDCGRIPPDRQQESPDFYLKAKEPGLCLECHAAEKKDLGPAHGNQPLGNSKCSGCHDAHSSDFPKRIPEFMHGPYGAKLCSACHPAPVDGKIQLAASDVDTLCYKCHTHFKGEMTGTKSRHKLLSQSNRACMECHDPHASNQEYNLKKPVQELCVGCHVGNTSKKETPVSQGGMPSLNAIMASKRFEETQMKYLKLSSKYVHEPARKSCLICHNAHASEFPRELRAPVRDLCMDCHGANSEKIVQSSQPFPLFKGRVSLPPKTFEKIRRFEMPGQYIHEPVNASCAFCHDAHASDYASELYAPVQDLCLACHGSNAGKIVQNEQPYPLFGGLVIVPPKTFEKMMQIDIIDGRFGHPTTRHPVSAPAAKGKAELNCVTCHRSHSAVSGPKLLVSDKEGLCRNCHSFY
jgi:predicted CXXCH cytochrome family protein